MFSGMKLYKSVHLFQFQIKRFTFSSGSWLSPRMKINPTKQQFYRFQLRTYDRRDFFYQKDIKAKINQKWSDANQNSNAKGGNGFSAEEKNKDFFTPNYSKKRGPVDEDYKEFIDKYTAFVKEREKRRLNFNRKDRWKQRELDDIFKNFDVKKAKFKDFSKLSQELQIVNKKEFTSIEEVFYYIDKVFVEGFAEEQISLALDVFIKDIGLFKAEHLKNESFIRFVKEVSQSIISISSEINLYKIAKFLDWYGIDYRNCWFNLEKAITNNRNNISPHILLKILNHFANQNEGSEEFYDMFQFLFWSDKFDKVSISDFVSLAYNLFVTRQGYEVFFYDYYNKLITKINQDIPTYDIIRILQAYSEISENYQDIYLKVEGIILPRAQFLEINEASCIACAFSISGFGSKKLFSLLEGILMENFNFLDDTGFRETVRAFVVSNSGSNDFFDLLKFRIKDKYELFNITEIIYILKCYSDREQGDPEFYSILERYLSGLIRNPDEILLEEICAISDGLCNTDVFSREFQKLLEYVINKRISDIVAKPTICRFLYEVFYNSGQCSPGLMQLLFKAYTG